jgi:hypothetical protein
MIAIKSANWQGRKCRGKERFQNPSSAPAQLPKCMVLEEITQSGKLNISNFIGGIRLFTQTQKENDF